MASGTVGDTGVTVSVGTHRVAILSEPLATFDAVEVPAAGSVVIESPRR